MSEIVEIKKRRTVYVIMEEHESTDDVGRDYYTTTALHVCETEELAKSVLDVLNSVFPPQEYSQHNRNPRRLIKRWIEPAPFMEIDKVEEALTV